MPNDHVSAAVDALQELGLKEYEARCFVGLSRLSSGTAKRLSEVTGVPRTRVYDAIRVLELQGLVVTHHSSPQRFRVVSTEEAIETLQNRYETQIERLTTALESVSNLERTGEDHLSEIWAMSGTDAITNRIRQLIEEAGERITLLISDEMLVTDGILEAIDGLGSTCEASIGTASPSVGRRIGEMIPDVETFSPDPEWIGYDEETVEGSDGTVPSIGRVLLVDRTTALVSTIGSAGETERAIIGRGANNGLVVLVRRLMATSPKGT